MFRIGVVALVLVSVGLTSGQETGIGLGTCTYSFVVQSPYCGKDVGGDAEADIQRLQGTVEDLKGRDRNLKVTVENLKTQLADMSREIAAVQSTHQGTDGDIKGTVLKLKGTVDSLKTQLIEMSREIAAVKSRLQSDGSVAESTPLVAGAMMEGHKYIFMGCRRDVTINVVYFVTAMVEPNNAHIISLNQTALTDGKHVLLESTLPPFPVFCTIDKFIVIQRRQKPFNLPFNRTWDEFKNGFGDVSGEFWLGLEKVYHITNQPYMKYLIRFEIKVTSGPLHYSESPHFYIASEKERYKILSIGGYIAATITQSVSVGYVFATLDKDLEGKCGYNYNGFWYYERRCLNGRMRFNRNVPSWASVDNNIEYTEIKIRPMTV